MKAIKNYLIIFAFSFFLCILAKYIFAFYSFRDIDFYQKSYAIFVGYKFDFAISAIIALLATFFDFNRKSLLFISLFLLLSLFSFLIGDIMYFADSSRHISYEIKDLFREFNGLIGTAVQTYWVLFLFSGVLLLVLAVILYKLLSFSLSKITLNWTYIPIKLCLIAISIFFIRGQFQHIPLNPSHAYNIGDSKLAMLSLNGAYNTIFQLVKNKGDIKTSTMYPTENESETLAQLYPTHIEQSEFPILDKPNIVLFFLESWAANYFKDYGGTYDIAPNLHHILTQSIRPKGMLAGGHRTVEGVFTTLTSFQNPLGNSIINTTLQDFNYVSLVDLLKERGYSSAFFQGSNRGTAAGNVAQKLGFSESYGREDIIERIYEENNWGVHDPDLYNFVIKKLENTKKPFIIGINGVTTHDDILPENYKMVHFTDDDEENRILNTYHFSDQATYDFIQNMLKIYPNTVFVIMADHVARLKDPNNFSQYLIPFAIYSPKLKARYIDQFISQRDVAPTLTDLVIGNYHQYTPTFTGKSLLQDNDYIADYYSNGVLGVVKGNLSVEIVNDKLTCYDVANYHPENIICPSQAGEYANQVKVLTNLQQSLLFTGKTRDFKNYRQ
ncbi:LTA synthase family protein [Otariodibacter sp.]|uniref:LTA synthase family protein n=1 Tax=Otariodibacter sp. TaxID=3030919 RepID=UPI002622EF7D|nr:LTA synthase family protein [Otariodibacter sp.]